MSNSCKKPDPPINWGCKADLIIQAHGTFWPAESSKTNKQVRNLTAKECGDKGVLICIIDRAGLMHLEKISLFFNPVNIRLFRFEREISYIRPGPGVCIWPVTGHHAIIPFAPACAERFTGVNYLFQITRG